MSELNSFLPVSTFFQGSSSTTAFSTQQTNGGFNFGSNAAAPPAPAPFAFGAASSNNEPAKPSFNFTGKKHENQIPYSIVRLY